MHTLNFVNIVNFMSDLLDPKNSTMLMEKSQQINQFSEKGLYVREDDQDWGSAGMNDIQIDQE